MLTVVTGSSREFTNRADFFSTAPAPRNLGLRGAEGCTGDGPWTRHVEERAMKMPRVNRVATAALGLLAGAAGRADAQCCLDSLFAGCCRKPAAYAVAPVAPVAAPVMAPVMAPVPAPPPPVMVPVQQTSYVPETTYRTQYQTVPVTTYKPSCEVDPCTGCTRECMQPVTQYVQQAVNVPVTQYRAVTTTKYVQMQPGYGGGYPAAGQQMIAAPAAAAAPAASPFAAPVQTAPQGWGAAGADIPQQLVPGSAPPALPATGVPQQTYQQPITPQSGSFMPTMPQAGIQPQPTQPPVLAPTPATTPTPSMKPIPELPRASTAPVAPPMLSPSNGTAAPSATAPQAPPATSGTIGGPQAMPVVPGPGPKASTGAFPRLLEPTGHTTSWQPAMLDASPLGRRPGYPTAALPARLQQ